MNLLLLGINWDKGASDWEPLEDHSEDYFHLIRTFGGSSAYSVINVLGSIGEKSLLPKGFHCLVSVLRNNGEQIIYLGKPDADRMMRKIYQKFASQMRSNRSLLADFLWTLDRMVELGSSQAYLMRENVIAYKSA